MRKFLFTTALAIFAACGATPAIAADGAAQTNAATPAITAPNGARVTLAGKIVSTSPDSFQLDVGADVLRIEMDDWDWFKEGKALKVGDDAVVTGRVDKDLWEQMKIEARSVFVKNLGVTFYASGTDDEDLGILTLVNPVSSTIGRVTSVEGAEFTVGSAAGSVRVDLSQLKVRPVVKVGDQVHAWGDVDVDRRERVELMADGVAVLTVDRTKRL